MWRADTPHPRPPTRQQMYGMLGEKDCARLRETVTVLSGGLLWGVPKSQEPRANRLLNWLEGT